MRCAYCEGEFSPKNSRGRFCSAKCRKAAWQRKREHALVRLEENLTHALIQVQAIRERSTRAEAMATEGRSGSWSRHQCAE